MEQEDLERAGLQNPGRGHSQRKARSDEHQSHVALVSYERGGAQRA